MKFFNSTKEPTEMDRVMENIAQTENEIRGRIYQLGEMFYQANQSKARGEVDEQYFALLDLINKLEHNRRGYYKNKLRLEGKMMCEHCGAVIPYGSMFCNVCGQRADGQTAVPVMGMSAAIPPMETPAQNMAPVGTAAETGAPAASAEAAIPPVELEPAAGEAVPAVHKCSQCGAVLSEGSLFCESCGVKVQ